MTTSTHEQGEKKELNLTEKVCLHLIKQCYETNAETMTITDENVTFQGESIGDWEITVKKLN